jgi:alpha-tubulin suppressor-like RCC1 family protein
LIDSKEMDPSSDVYFTLSGTSAIALALGAAHTCALMNVSTVVCWGDNEFGQLGIGSTVDVGTAPGQMGANLIPVDLGPGRTAFRVLSDSILSTAH